MTEQHPPPTPDALRRADDAEAIDDPLTDCLIQLCRLYNLPATRTALRAGLPLVDNRLTVELFPRAAERAGLAARLLKRPLARMTGLELPAVLLLADGRACLLAALDHEGGEATVLLPETGLGGAILVAERLRQQIATQAIDIGDGQTLQCTLSIGVACLDDATIDLEKLLHRADTALYSAKNGGRNKVVSYAADRPA